MELNNIEKQIREKLKEREIQPSNQAWDRLDAMLSVEEGKPEKKSFVWRKIAATIVLFLSISYLFFQENTSNNLETVVEVQTKSTPSIRENIVVISKQNQEVVVAANNEKELISNSNAEVVQTYKGSTKEKIQIKKSLVLKSTKEKSLATNEQKSNSVIESNKEEAHEEIIKVIEETPSSALVQNSVKITKPKIKIDPNALLNQVDGEMNLTFRQKVMQSIRKNYDETREALVNRNHQ